LAKDRLMDTHITFEQLSEERKKEVRNFHDSRMENESEATIDSSLKLWFESRFDEWLLQRFGSDEDKNQRKHARIDVELPVKVVETLIDGVTMDTEDIDLLGTIVNISRGGLYFRSIKPFEESSIIKVVIDLSSLDHSFDSFEALAMVMRVEKLDDGLYGIGVMFSTIYEDNKHTLDMYIFKNVAYFLHNP
jgi:hypothetical protein